MTEFLTHEQIDRLPLGTRLRVYWSGGNTGTYTIVGRGKHSGTTWVATDLEVRLGLNPTNYVPEFLGDKPPANRIQLVNPGE